MGAQEARGSYAYGANMELNSEKLVIYFGTLNSSKTLSEVAEDLYGEKKNSVRSAFSRKKALDEMLEEGLLVGKKEGRWRYAANKDRLGEVLSYLLEHEDEHVDEFNLEIEDLDTLDEMSKNNQILRYFENEKLSNILGDSVSQADKQLSMYFTLVYIALTGSRILIEDLNLSQGQEVNLTEDGVERLETMVDLINFASQESPLRIGAIFEEIMKTSTEVDIMQIPRTESPKIKKLAESAKKFITEFLDVEIESMVNVGGQTAPA